MDKTKIQKLLELIDEIVRAAGPYREKTEAIYAECSDDDKIALAEFSSWFAE